jgi:hypothetical protein
MSEKNAWLPLLMINGTSVRTGRRIITGDLSASEVVPLAYDLNELRTVKGASASDDIRLSTAATMSARFPIISPHGIILDRAGEVVDFVVDGGHFENDGLATAADMGLSP